MARTGRTRVLLAALAAAALAGQATPAAAGDGGDDERTDVRVRGTCSGASRSTLRVRADDGRIRVEFELEPARRGSVWTLILLHERRIVARATPRAEGGGRISFRRTVEDWFGTDELVVRATARRGETCRASARV